MSSINTTFQPVGPSVAIASGSPAQALSNGAASSFRIVNTSAANLLARVAWGRTAALTPVPTIAGPNNLLIPANAVIYIDVPNDSFFNVIAAGAIEVTPGIGGIGG
jgi:hypothetical protein